MNIIIIGGGFAGCSSAEMLSNLKNTKVTIIEKSNFLGAGVRTFFYGGHPYTYGPRHFITKNFETYKYLNKFVKLRNVNYHEFKCYVESEDNFYNYPISLEDIKNMKEKTKIKNEIKNIKKQIDAQNLEEYWVNSVGKTLFNKFIDKYNKKMWMVESCKQIDTFNWSPKGSPLKKKRGSPFKDRISAYPYAKDGYNAYFDYVQNSKKINKLFNCNIKILNASKKFVILNNNKKIHYDYLINTVSPDEIYNYEYGKLNFIGRDLHLIVLPRKNIFPKNVFFLYYPNNEKFTRLVEYKKFTQHKSNSSLIGMEIPSLNGKYYPIPVSSEQKKAKKYFKLMKDNIYSIGRAGTYRYEVDIDDSIAQSIEIFNQIKNKNYYGPIIGDEFR